MPNQTLVGHSRNGFWKDIEATLFYSNSQSIILWVSGIAELKKTGTIMQAKKRVDDILLLSKILPEFIWPKNLMSTELKGNSKKVHTKASCCLSLFEYKVKYVYKQYPKWLSIAPTDRPTDRPTDQSIIFFFRFASEWMKKTIIGLIHFTFMAHIMNCINTMKLIANMESKYQD